MDRLITTVSGMESFLRCRDLPSFCRVSDLNDWQLHVAVTETRRTPQAHAFILNTFEDLEGPIPPIYALDVPKYTPLDPSTRT